jgi:hypothetical protein
VVERNLAKVDVARSNRVTRSEKTSSKNLTSSVWAKYGGFDFSQNILEEA